MTQTGRRPTLGQNLGHCSFTNGFGLEHHDLDAQWRIVNAAIEDNPENDPTASPERRLAVAMTQNFLADNTVMPDEMVERQGLILNTPRKWKTGRTIRVYFLDGPEDAHAECIAIFNRWTKYANLEFVRETNPGAAEEHVTYRPGGSWAILGNGALGVSGPTMQLGWYLNVRGAAVVLHECGHWLAFPHEQFHPERHCEYNKAVVYQELGGPPNNWSKAQIDFNVLRPPVPDAGFEWSKYNPGSIMHYAQPQRWFTTPNCEVGQNKRLSHLDKKYAAIWYPGRIDPDTI